MLRFGLREAFNNKHKFVQMVAKVAIFKYIGSNIRIYQKIFKKNIRIYPNISKYIRKYQNISECIRIYQNISEQARAELCQALAKLA